MKKILSNREIGNAFEKEFSKYCRNMNSKNIIKKFEEIHEQEADYLFNIKGFSFFVEMKATKNNNFKPKNFSQVRNLVTYSKLHKNYNAYLIVHLNFTCVEDFNLENIRVYDFKNKKLEKLLESEVYKLLK